MKKIFAGIFILFLLTLLAGCLPALQDTAYKGDTKALKEMLDGGADVNDSFSGCTLLIFAATGGKLDTVRLLLDRGADINAKYNGNGVLFWAAYFGHADVAKLLIDRGSDVDYAIDSLGSSDCEKSQCKTGLKLLERLAKRALPSKQTETLAAKPSPEAYITVKSDVDELPAMSEPRKNAYAVVIGIENYRSLPKSDYSRSDATLVKAYLKALGFQERNIEFLTDEKATRTDIEKSLEAWLPNRAKKDSTVLVYFSGHGAPEPAKGEAYLVPYDGDPNYLPVTGYPLKRLYASLGKLEAREIIVVLDSCFSGSGGRSVLAKGARPLVMMAPTGILSSNIAVLSATQGSQISTSSPQKGHGVFTYYFLKAIKDGKKNLAEIYEYITPQVEDEAKMLNVQQSPSISPDVEKIKNKFSLMK